MKDPEFLFYPGDYLTDTQCLSEKTQVAYDRIMCEHMRNICISQKQLKFFTKRLSPDETEEDILDSFRFAARLKIDTFGFNRLCVYRGTPLWQEYIDRGIIEDDRDWYKWFKCSDIDPTILPSEVVNETRKKGYILMIKYKLLHRPVATLGLVRQFMRYMKFSDVMKLISSPFRKKTFTYNPDLPEKMIEQGLDAPIRIAS